MSRREKTKGLKLDELCSRAAECRETTLSTDVTLGEMILVIGWTHEEFLEACADYTGEGTYDWERVFRTLWAATYNRIHSNLDLIHKFRYYNDWKFVVDYALTLNNSRLINPLLNDTITLEDFEEYLKTKNHKKPILPSESYEKKVIWAVIQIIVYLHNFIIKYPEYSFQQISGIREAVDFVQTELENRRNARRNKKLNRKNKNKRK